MTLVEQPNRSADFVRREIRTRMRSQKIWSIGDAKPGKTSHIEVPLLTVNETPTTLAVTPETKAMFAPKPLSQEGFMNIAKILAGNQHRYLPIGVEEEHQKTILFLTQNWRRIRKYLYPFYASGNFPAANFSEVDLKDDKKQRADFIGFGPDGRLFIIEVGTRSKSGQVDGYIDPLKELIADTASISPFVAYYSANERGKTIELKPPYIPKIEHTEKAVEFIKDLGQNALPVPQRPHLHRFIR